MMNPSPIQAVEDSEKGLRGFLACGARAVNGLDANDVSDGQWFAIPAKDFSQSQPKRPDLPYISVLKMDTWHLGIPYRTDGERVVVVDTGNVYSVQFHGPHAKSTAELVSVWIRGHEAYMLQYADGKPDFYIRRYQQAQDLSALVNGKWEEKAVVNMEVRHRIALKQGVGQIDSDSIGVYDHDQDYDNEDETPNITVEVERA